MPLPVVGRLRTLIEGWGGYAVLNIMGQAPGEAQPAVAAVLASMASNLSVKPVLVPSALAQLNIT